MAKIYSWNKKVFHAILPKYISTNALRPLNHLRVNAPVCGIDTTFFLTSSGAVCIKFCIEVLNFNLGVIMNLERQGKKEKTRKGDKWEKEDK